MELALIDKERRTRIKLTRQEFKSWKNYLEKSGIDTSKPTKQSSRYIYFEVDGDLLNKNVEVENETN